jgi:hypothetical protein
MRVLAAYILSLALIASPAIAKAGRTSDDGTPKADSTTDAKAKTDAPATAPKTDNAPAKAESGTLEVELQQLRDLLQAQAQQLKAQSDQLKQQQEKMESLEKQLNSTNTANGASSVSAAPAGVNAATESSSSASGPSSGIITAGVSNKPASGSSAAAGQDMNKGDEPASIHFKGVTLTPGGFMAAETAYRTKALSADVNTPFTSIPLPGASNANVSEFNGSGRQSRISMLVEGKLSNVKVGGYYEADFLGGGSTSNSNQSNSYVYRQRQIWGQAAFDNGFTVTGGQMWSLVTQTTHGMDNRTEYLPLTIDAQYQAGFSWARQYGLRFTKDFENKLWLGFAVENAQTTFKVHGNPTTTTGAVTLPCVGDPGCPSSGTVSVGTTTTVTNFLLGASGTSGGLLNPLANYSYNPSPDLVFKAVLEPGFGHYEIFGVYSRFRDVAFPCEVATNFTPTACPNIATSPFAPSAALSFNDARNGGGVGGNVLWNLFAKHLDFGVHFFGGNGVGRYGSAGLSDATIRPDGTIALLKNYQALGTIVVHPTPKLDIYLNAGGDYASRAAYSFTNLAGTTTTQEGYGNPGFNNSGCYTTASPTTTTPVGTTAGAGYVPSAPGNCTGDPRSIIEGTLGFWYRFYQGSRGRVQFGMQYSYAELSTWSGKPATNVGSPNGVASPSTAENMWFTSLRYYLP